MARIKVYTDRDVVTEARTRLRRIFNLFDSVAVCFSGGKDSLVTLRLAWQIAQELGRRSLDVVFRDEELIPDSVIAFVDEYRREPWVKMRWFTIPLQSEKFVLGKRASYVQWDPDRRWLRPKPAWGINLPAGRSGVLSQYDADEFCAAGLPGSVAFLTGIRADESLVRLRSVVNKLNDNYICKPGGQGKTRVRLCKPIYDWRENDIFKWLGEHEIRYCPVYESQHFAAAGLRVSTPLHAESAKRFADLRAIAPVFYQQIVDLFPEMLLQDRYWTEFDAAGLRARYSDGFAGCRRFIIEQIQDPKQRALAMKRLREFRSLSQRSPESYPPSLLLRALSTGSLKRTLTPARPTKKPSIKS